MAYKLVCGIMRDLEAEELAYQRRAQAIRSASISLMEAEIARTIARHELESDEFFTAREKAILLLR